MKQAVSTRTHILLQITLALCVATYIGLTSHWFILACMAYAGSIVFSFLTIFSHVRKGERKVKLIIMTYCSIISISLFLLVYVLQEAWKEFRILYAIKYPPGFVTAVTHTKMKHRKVLIKANIVTNVQILCMTGYIPQRL